MARAYLKRHWDTWVTEDDIAKIADAGLTHVKIPIGHWIRGDIGEGEPWVDGDWHFFARAVGWCRKYGLKVVADIHTAPGSQNGFDNSGQFLNQRTAKHWSTHPDRVARSIKAVEDVAVAVKDEGMDDVVTGIEILNEIYSDANITTVKEFYDKSFEAIHRILPNATVVASDNFDSGQFNGFWTDPNKYSNTLLDTHLYTVFSEKLRSMSPKQHVAFVCGNHYNIQMMKCCWDDDGRSQGLGRIIGEWTASYDMDVATMITVVFDETRETGVAPRFDREISPGEMKMLRNYIEAQMVVYEGKVTGETNGWFYWNFKVQGGVFAEWDLLRGVDEGWFPKVDASIPARQMMKCCWDDDGRSQGLGRIIGEWTASYDMDVATMITVVFDETRETGVAPRFDREISPGEMKMLRNYIEAQMVVYEGKVTGETNGWFYWNFKVQGGVFAEWDLLRGVDEGWFPKVDASIPARERFGDCEDIILRTKDDLSVIHEYPNPKDLPSELIEDRHFDDDIVSTHGHSLERPHRAHQIWCSLVALSVAMLIFAVLRGRHRLLPRKQRKEYDELPDADIEVVVQTPPPTPSP